MIQYTHRLLLQSAIFLPFWLFVPNLGFHPFSYSWLVITRERPMNSHPGGLGGSFRRLGGERKRCQRPGASVPEQRATAAAEDQGDHGQDCTDFFSDHNDQNDFNGPSCSILFLMLRPGAKSCGVEWKRSHSSWRRHGMECRWVGETGWNFPMCRKDPGRLYQPFFDCLHRVI